MPRYIAFLRAINVGAHLVKMDVLRKLFESAGLSNVETFIASGNVMFESSARNAKTLEQKLENILEEALGYEVATFIRTEAEVKAIASHKPFKNVEPDPALGIMLYIGMMPEEPSASAKKKVMSQRTDDDDFHFHGREVYWLCRKRMLESKFSYAFFEKTVGVPMTFRGVNTIKRLAAKFEE